MKKITDVKQLKIGKHIFFKNKKEEAVMKIKAINTSWFSDAVDIECTVGRLEALVIGADIKDGFVYLSKSKKTYYKKL